MTESVYINAAPGSCGRCPYCGRIVRGDDPSTFHTDVLTPGQERRLLELVNR
jgi:hypothetical protein